MVLVVPVKGVFQGLLHEGVRHEMHLNLTPLGAIDSFLIVILNEWIVILLSQCLVGGQVTQHKDQYCGEEDTKLSHF